MTAGEAVQPTTGNRWEQFTDAETTVIQASLGHVTGAIIEEAMSGQIPEEHRADAAVTFATGLPLMLEISASRGEHVPSVGSVLTLAASIAAGTTPSLAEVDDEPDPDEPEVLAEAA